MDVLWSGAHTRRPGRNRLPPAACVAVCLALGLAGGCEFRVEPVRPVLGRGLWPPAAERADGDAADATAREATRVEYVEGYAAAARRAAAEGRPLLLVFGAEWCRWSGELAHGPLADREVVARTRRFVCAIVDADRESAICGTFGVAAFPTVIVLDADGRERFRAVGTGAAGGLAAALDTVAAPGASRRLADDRRPPDAAHDITR